MEAGNEVKVISESFRSVKKSTKRKSKKEKEGKKEGGKKEGRLVG